MDILVSVIIKALNEQEKIAKCIESVLNEVKLLNAEILVIDSVSTDKTVEIAHNYPVKIFQFSNLIDRGCGAAAQLGFQQSKGDFVYLIDGDMEMAPGFLEKAILFLQEHTDVAGVGGVLIDTEINSAADLRRARRYSRVHSIHTVSSLGGGGLYRREMIEDVEYFSHRGLHACEEAELGVRLSCSGKKLIRLPIPSVYHTGHKESSIRTIQRIWANGRLAAHAVFLKSSFGTKWWWRTLRHEWVLIAPFAIYSAIFFVYGITCALLNCSIYLLVSIFSATWALILCLLTVKHKSFSAALLSIYTWHMIAASAIRPFFSPIKSPLEKIDFLLLKDSTPEKQEKNVTP